MIENIPKWKSINETHRQFVKYLVVGGSTALCEVLLFTLLVRVIQLRLDLSNIAAVVLAAILNFFLNKVWAFQSRAEVNRSLVLYIMLFLFNLFFSTYFIYTLVRWGLLDIIAKLISMALITVWNFMLYRQVIFAVSSRDYQE